MRTHLIASALASVALCAPAFAEETKPFVDLTFEQAIEKAAEEDKAVFVDFYTTWCPPCKMLDAQTWPDASVRELLTERTIPLKIDAEEQVALARRYQVRAYPTLIFINAQGEEMDRIVGFRAPQDFVNEAKPILDGRTKEQRVNEIVEAAERIDEGEGHGQKTLMAGRQLARAGRHEEALEMYLKVFDNPGHGMGGVRVSFLLRDILELGEEFPPALDALRQRRDAAAQRVVGGGGDWSDVQDVIRIDVELEQPAATVEFVRQAHAAEQMHLLNNLGDDLVSVLVSEQEYELAHTVIDVPDAVMRAFESHDFQVEMLKERMQEDPRLARLLHLSRTRFAQTVAQHYEVMVALGFAHEADRVAGDLINKYPQDIAVYRELAKSAERAGDASHVAKHVEPALEHEGWSDKARAELRRILERARVAG